MPFAQKSARKPDEKRKFPKGVMEVVMIGGHAIGRSTMEPGWKWSTSVKPIAKTKSCRGHHIGYIVSGSLSGVMDTGRKWRLVAGDFFDIPPGHDAWTVGKEPVVMIDYMGVAAYAKPK